MGIKRTELEDKPLVHGKAAYRHVLSGVVRQRLKSRATGLDASLSFRSTSRSLNLLPVSPMYIFLHKVRFMQEITLAEVHVKRSVILID